MINVNDFIILFSLLEIMKKTIKICDQIYSSKSSGGL